MTQINPQTKQEVINMFLTSKNNSTSTIAAALNISANTVEQVLKTALIERLAKEQEPNNTIPTIDPFPDLSFRERLVKAGIGKGEIRLANRNLKTAVRLKNNYFLK